MGRDGDEGQAAVEVALVLPLIVMLLLAVVQVTLVARDQVLVVHAARAGARAAAVDGAPASARHAVLGSASDLEPGRLDVDQRTFGGAATTTVRIEVTYRSPTDLPLIGALLPDVHLRANAAMREESGT